MDKPDCASRWKPELAWANSVGHLIVTEQTKSRPSSSPKRICSLMNCLLRLG